MDDDSVDDTTDMIKGALDSIVADLGGAAPSLILAKLASVMGMEVVQGDAKEVVAGLQQEVAKGVAAADEAATALAAATASEEQARSELVRVQRLNSLAKAKVQQLEDRVASLLSEADSHNATVLGLCEQRDELARQLSAVPVPAVQPRGPHARSPIAKRSAAAVAGQDLKEVKFKVAKTGAGELAGLLRSLVAQHKELHRGIQSVAAVFTTGQLLALLHQARVWYDAVRVAYPNRASFYDEGMIATIHPLSFAVAIVQATKAVVSTGRRGELVACMYPQPPEGGSTCMHCGDELKAGRHVRGAGKIGRKASQCPVSLKHAPQCEVCSLFYRLCGLEPPRHARHALCVCPIGDGGVNLKSLYQFLVDHGVEREAKPAPAPMAPCVEISPES